MELLILIKERKINQTIENIQILGTVLMEGKDKSVLIEDLQESFTIENNHTDLKALEQLKAQMKWGE
ncbi:hypothetical protein [Clostridium pasteurianum]|uniref:hypothetical protein n=1 Tax=Clostridium pasteurianum TaxID=1501 RepID=UPI00155AEDB7|nr:hypothetical protein [Clostridium pasteurianum]